MFRVRIECGPLFFLVDASIEIEQLTTTCAYYNGGSRLPWKVVPFMASFPIHLSVF